MKKHLQSCLGKRKAESFKDGKTAFQEIFLILVEGYGVSGDKYWLYLAASENASFKDLDNFLRKIWLECCGHLSAFRTGKLEVGKGQKLGHILTSGEKFFYEYDFGDTTELKLSVLGVSEAPIMKRKIQVLARNDAPPIPCSYCGKLATAICLECLYDGKGWLCDDCGPDHECNEEMRLPLVNSPRTGVCGYTG
jgi:hypothetical protein